VCVNFILSCFFLILSSQILICHDGIIRHLNFSVSALGVGPHLHNFRETEDVHKSREPELIISNIDC
jgi:hypothetical protein